jgi:hypothetical protein
MRRVNPGIDTECHPGNAKHYPGSRKIIITIIILWIPAFAGMTKQVGCAKQCAAHRLGTCVPWMVRNSSTGMYVPEKENLPRQKQYEYVTND